ncbi:MAG: hypothetical protein L0H96_20340 [Humibacillus sp.]|nr:hypothetical protein [Humibacillus sp.]MDN5779246.1 hypothetical protein [Humibacillus sp.]
MTASTTTNRNQQEDNMTTTTERTDLEEATALVDDLEERILRGDQAVTAADLADARGRARSLSSFATLRQGAALRREQAERAARTQKVAEETRATLAPMIEAGRFRALAADPGRDKAVAGAVSALRAFFAPIDDADEQLRQLVLRAKAEGMVDDVPVAGVRLYDGNLEVEGVGWAFARQAGCDRADAMRNMLAEVAQAVQA